MDTFPVKHLMSPLWSLALTPYRQGARYKCHNSWLTIRSWRLYNEAKIQIQWWVSSFWHGGLSNTRSYRAAHFLPGSSGLDKGLCRMPGGMDQRHFLSGDIFKSAPLNKDVMILVGIFPIARSKDLKINKAKVGYQTCSLNPTALSSQRPQPTLGGQSGPHLSEKGNIKRRIYINSRLLRNKINMSEWNIARWPSGVTFENA